MAQSFYKDRKIGVLGGGQLGRMLIQSGIDLNIHFAFLDPDPQAPCSKFSEFSVGDLTDYQTVFDFGRHCEVITIEIEHVNTAALRDLADMGKQVFPQPDVIELIQDKRLQKQFYTSKGIPTAPFILTQSKEDVYANRSMLPAVNKLGKAGYDGRGVKILRNEDDLDGAFDSPGILEEVVDFEKEISVIVARNENQEIVSYPPVEMVFHPTANLVEYLIAPATLPADVSIQADKIARNVIIALDMVGLLAVEMFVTRGGEVLVNEVAPRPHNSGHQSIEGNVTSQYEQHLRAILNLPLGSTASRGLGGMVNLLGAEGFEGEAKYHNLEAVLKLQGVHLHLYGKKKTKPFRKMGHATVLDDDIQSLREKLKFIKDNLIVST